MLTGCASGSARGLAIDAAAAQFAGVKDRVEREIWTVPATGFVDFIDGEGLRIGWSAIGDERIEFQGGSQTIVFDASDTDGVGAVDVVVTGLGSEGTGDLYEDVKVYSCFRVLIDIDEKAVRGYEDLECPIIVLGPLSAYEDVDLRDIS